MHPILSCSASRASCIALVGMLLSPASPAADAIPPVDYHFRFEPEHSTLSARVCVADAARIRSFRAVEDPDGDFLHEPKRSSGAALETKGGAVQARDWKAGECLLYQVDLGEIAAKRNMDVGMKVGEDLLTSSAAWMWRPQSLGRDDQAQVGFELPDGYALSVPWKPLDAKPHRRFEVGSTSPAWPAMVAIGRFAGEQFDAGQGQVRLAILGSPAADDAEKLRRYVRNSAKDVADSFPRIFAERPQLVLIPGPRGREAVGFGLSVRGGGQGVLLFVNPKFPNADFDRAWTLTHEFVHVLHPHLEPAGRWISEGIATYYQNVLRARAGRLSAQEAWDELDAGFARGRADRATTSLGETSIHMDEGRHYMRGYWSGAALMLRADVALRTRKVNPSSLDAALNGFIDCCRQQKRDWDAVEYLAALDHAVGGSVFSDLYRQHVDGVAFPELGEAYGVLGLEHASDHVTHGGDAAAAELRKGIMGSD